MPETKANDYDLSPAAVLWLKGVVNLPEEYRLMALEQAASEHGAQEIISWFSQFIGLANSVVSNNREAIEIFDITENGAHPHVSEKLNLPTIFGALQGLELSKNSCSKGRCKGCAFRKGSLANQSAFTTSDAEFALDDDSVFWCHEDMTDDGKPTRKCSGWAESRSQRKKQAVISKGSLNQNPAQSF